jgi:hypothetical protein
LKGFQPEIFVEEKNMRVYKIMLLMSLFGLVTVSPAMAWGYFNVGVNFDRGYYYAPPVIVERPHYRVVRAYKYYDPVVYEDEAPVVVEEPYYPVVYPRYSVGFTYFGDYGYYGGGHGYYRGGHGYYGGGHGYYRGGHGYRHH